MGTIDPKKAEEFERIINEFKNRRIYEELSAEILSDIPDDQLVQAIVDHVGTKITDFRNELEIVSSLSPGLRMVYSTQILEAEVENGGFNQFFYNSSRRFAEMAWESRQLLGASDYLRILEKALAIYVQETEANPLLKQLYAKRTIESFFATYELSSLDKCDDEFYALGDQLSELRIKYIRNHIQEFIST